MLRERDWSVKFRYGIRVSHCRFGLCHLDLQLLRVAIGESQEEHEPENASGAR